MLNILSNRLRRLTSALKALVHEQRGATATEYGILVSFLAFALILGVTAFGQALNAHYMALTTTLKAALGIP